MKQSRVIGQYQGFNHASSFRSQAGLSEQQLPGGGGDCLLLPDSTCMLLEPVDRLADFKLPGNLGYSSDVPAIFINPYKNVDKKCDMEILKNLLSIQ